MGLRPSLPTLDRDLGDSRGRADVLKSLLEMDGIAFSQPGSQEDWTDMPHALYDSPSDAEGAKYPEQFPGFGRDSDKFNRAYSGLRGCQSFSLGGAETQGKQLLDARASCLLPAAPPLLALTLLPLASKLLVREEPKPCLSCRLMFAFLLGAFLRGAFVLGAFVLGAFVLGAFLRSPPGVL